MLGWIASVAAAAEPTEEVVVWGDRFARWQRRWSVQTEVRYLEPQTLFASRNNELSYVAVQIRAVLDCKVDFVLGPGSREVTCAIEDVGLVALPRMQVPTNARVLEEADASLTGATVQLQVREAGQVTDVDLEGIAWTNDRERQRVEQLRALMSRAVLPFHLEMNDAVRTGDRWYEYDSQLFRMPAATASVGGSTMAHYLNRLDDRHFIIQSIGAATMTSPPRDGVLQVSFEASSDAVPREWTPPRDVVAVDMHGVAILDRDTGILSERVWVVSGQVTAASPNAIRLVGWYHGGRLRMLGQQERVDVGSTWVARSLARDDPAPEWVSLDP